jgi:hypothetical protein
VSEYPDTVPCFSCGKPLKDWSHGNNQPFDAVEFAARGHYPSALWDPSDGSELVVNLCDDCLCAGAASGRVLRRTYPQGRPRGAQPTYAAWRPGR